MAFGGVSKFGSLGVLACLFALSACNEKDVQELNSAVSMKLDPSLTSQETTLIRSDINRIISYGIEAKEGDFYQIIFGGRDSTAALRFLDERVNYVIGENVDFADRIREDRSGTQRINALSDETEKAVTMASNIGTALWMIEATNPQLPIAVQLGTKTIPINSPRIGLVQLGAGYTMEETKMGALITPAIRIGTLIHESRHSDCTGGLDLSTVRQLLEGTLTEGALCGHLHATCPADHDLAGLPGCDAQPWGAYAVEAFFSREIALNCKNCTELERQQALMATVDSFSRVLILPEMIAGEYGEPDMTSSDEVRANDPLVRAFRDATQFNWRSNAPVPIELVVK